MKKKLPRRFWLMLFICFLGTPNLLTANSINFISGDFQTISKKSLEENKYFFVNYSAEWCAACEVMMESANANIDLVNYIDEKFIAVKANVESEDGRAWQTKFEVKYLPTIIIFTPDGKEFARASGGITSSKFLSFLQKTESENTETVSFNHSNSNLGEVKSSILSSTADVISKNKNEAEIIFRVQVGLYSTEKNAIKKIEKVKNKINHPMYYRKEKMKGKLFYQVVIGELLSEQEAFRLQKDLSKKRIKSYILKY